MRPRETQRLFILPVSKGSTIRVLKTSSLAAVLLLQVLWTVSVAREAENAKATGPRAYLRPIEELLE